MWCLIDWIVWSMLVMVWCLVILLISILLFLVKVMMDGVVCLFLVFVMMVGLLFFRMDMMEFVVFRLMLIVRVIRCFFVCLGCGVL